MKKIKWRLIILGVLFILALVLGAPRINAVLQNNKVPLADNETMVTDLTQYPFDKLVDNSDFIVVGKVVEQNYILAHLGRPIVLTENKILVNQVIKGDIQVGSYQLVRVQGGRYVDEVTGQNMIETVSNEASLNKDNEYVLFLKTSTDRRNPIFTQEEKNIEGLSKVTTAFGRAGEFTIENNLIGEIGINENLFIEHITSLVNK